MKKQKEEGKKKSNGGMAVRLANLELGAQYRWKKGHSGNPKGRTPFKPLTDELREMIEMPLSKKSSKAIRRRILRILLKRAEKGNLTAINMVFDRLLGRPAQSIHVDDNRENPLDNLIAALKGKHEEAGDPQGDDD